MLCFLTVSCCKLKPYQQISPIVLNKRARFHPSLHTYGFYINAPTIYARNFISIGAIQSVSSIFSKQHLLTEKLILTRKFCLKKTHHSYRRCLQWLAVRLR